MIPNIVHFNYGLMQQTEEFLFVYYVAVLSCKIINKPEKIFFHYHYEPKGQWWEKTKKLVDLIIVDIPTMVGSKEILQTAHKSDVLRLNILEKYGGIYLDIDTICVRPWKDLLYNKCVIPKEVNSTGCLGLCNAIIMAEQNSEFIKEWQLNYENYFNPNGWQEASTILPFELSKVSDNITVLNSNTMLEPSWNEIQKIFEEPNDIPEELITLHFWNQYSHHLYLNNINNFDWAIDNCHTLYGKLLSKLFTRLKHHSEDICSTTAIEHVQYNMFNDNINVTVYNNLNHTKIKTNEDAKEHYTKHKCNNLILAPIFKNDFVLCDYVAYPFFNSVFNYNVIPNIDTSIKYIVDLCYYYYKITFEKTNILFHARLRQDNISLELYKLYKTPIIYVFHPNYKIKNDTSIFVKENICSNSKFRFKKQFITQSEILMEISHIDKDVGWSENLYLQLFIKSKSYYFYVGKSSEPTKRVVINLNNPDNNYLLLGNNTTTDIIKKHYIEAKTQDGVSIVNSDLTNINTALFSNKYYQDIRNLNSDKIYDYCFIGSFNHNKQNWMKDFIMKRFSIKSIFINTDANEQWELLGSFDKTNNKEFENNHLKYMRQSKYTLIPSNDDLWDFRFYESIMCGSIPIVKTYHETYRTAEETLIKYKYYLHDDIIIYNPEMVITNTTLFEKNHLC